MAATLLATPGPAQTHLTWSGDSKRLLYDEANPVLPAGNTPGTAVRQRAALVAGHPDFLPDSSGLTWAFINPAARPVGSRPFHAARKTTAPGIVETHAHFHAHVPSIDRNRMIPYTPLVQTGE
ncbi:MAG: hypothetical protein QOJ99_6204 [Bryobacterales bacterium]|jgi:hypothetical protein|nr:hypothetical protein [Bryobacterales bacterium]